MDENKPSVKWFIETQSEWFLQNGIPKWFHGVITRKDAEDLLKDKTIGCFLIRVSESRIGYSLSYRVQDRCRHFMIDVLKDQQCMLSGDARIHNTLEDLVNFHTQYPLYPYNELLIHPCGQKSESTADYEELFQNTSKLPKPFHSPEPSPIGMVLPPSLPIETHIPPPLPQRKLQTSNSCNFPIMTPPGYPTTPSKLYPYLHTEMHVPSDSVPVHPHVQKSITKSESVDFTNPNLTHNSNLPTKNGENLGNSSKKPLKTCKTALNKAVCFMKEGELAQDLKKMENTMAAQIKNVRDSFGRLGNIGQKDLSPSLQQSYHQPRVPEEYRAPPPFAPGFS